MSFAVSKPTVYLLWLLTS